MKLEAQADWLEKTEDEEREIEREREREEFGTFIISFCFFKCSSQV